MRNTVSNNVFIGYQSGISNETGSNNIFLGYRTGWLNTRGGDNILIGHGIDDASSKQLNIGHLIKGNMNGVSSGTISYPTSLGIDVAGTVQSNGSALTSDKRLKKKYNSFKKIIKRYFIFKT